MHVSLLQTGFSQGTPSIENDDELASQVMGFLEQFLDVFSELKGKDLYLSGESVNSSHRLATARSILTYFNDDL